ncbi:MAG: hypothetical protein DSZ29_00505 [Aquificaceae bacterium]|nr:MAG: hypothetical protein DSZ29_00505 [Aquificaceae bacterium]
MRKSEMKNTILSIAIASSLTTLLTGNVFATGNTMTVNQTNSAGSVTLTQGAAGSTSNSKITVIQKDADVATSITVGQIDANGVEAKINQDGGVGSIITINQSGGATQANPNFTNIVNIDQGSVGGVNIGNSFTVTTQSGSGNAIVGYMGDHTSSAKQVGATNTATLIQDGSDSTIGFTQEGLSNTATVTQETGSAHNTLNVSQAGATNTVTTVQTADTSNSSLEVSLNGTDNKVATTQGGAGILTSSNIKIDITGDNNNLGDASHKIEQLSSGSSIDIAITGSLNEANLSQAFGSAGSSMMLTQEGDSNKAEMAQIGMSNTMNLSQTTTGNLNIATLTQNGTTDTMNVTQIDGGTVTLTQN